MPCNSDHLEPHLKEIEGSKVKTLLDTLNGEPFNKDHFRGFHPEVYSKRYSKRQFDKDTATLCSRMKKFSEDEVKEQQLELQIWWKDHQEADAKREANKNK